ncbi:hypothetical protein [Mucilaginibacter sp.]|uniref:hypothetical protein n=1 Tax=Mucilaginibacter sp. TaxID=1882438 RepID=UPI0035BBD142
MVFDTDVVLTADAKQVQETSFKFLERSSWNRCAMVRGLVSSWLAEMDYDAEFISQIKSKNDKQHYAALFELVVYNFLKRQGFGVSKHPELLKSTTPDFSMKVDTEGYFLECTLSGNSFETIEEERRKGAVEDIIRQIHYYPYFINLDFKSIAKTSVSARKIRKFIDLVKDNSEGFSNEELFYRRYLYEDGGWKIEISLLRKSHDGIKTSLGVIENDAKVIDSKKAILSALNDKKPSKYGITDAPYIICICNNDMFFKEDEMYSVLFGTDNGTYINLSYPESSGFFYHRSPINTTVSAILFFKNTDVLTLGGAKWSVWHNPFAKNPIAYSLFPVDEYYFEIIGENLIKKQIIKEANVFSLLDIDEIRYNTDPKSTDES